MSTGNLTVDGFHRMKAYIPEKRELAIVIHPKWPYEYIHAHVSVALQHRAIILFSEKLDEAQMVASITPLEDSLKITMPASTNWAYGTGIDYSDPLPGTGKPNRKAKRTKSQARAKRRQTRSSRKRNRR